MQDRMPGAPGQYKATLTAAEFQKMQAGQQFTITMIRDDQPIVEGTPYSKAAVLPDDLAKIICGNIVNPTPANAFRGLLQKLSHRNLLDNSDFRNPVNQRGEKVYAYVDKYMHTIDRWNISSEGASVTVEDGYISKTASMSQKIAGLDKNKTYTAVVCSQDGTVSCYCGTIANGIGSWYDNAYVYSGTEDLTIFAFPARGCSEIQWAALYEGEYTAETLPEYKPKGYAAELAECMRYYQKFGTLQIPATPYSATSILLTPPCKTEMRLKPTLTVTDMSHLRCGGKTLSTFPTYTVAAFGGSPESPNFTMTFVSEHGLPLANAGFLYMAGELLADL